MAAFREVAKAVKMQPFPFRVQVIVTSDVNQSIIKRERLVGKHEPNDSIYALQCESARGDGISYIFLPFDADPGTVAHESYHAIRTMLRFVGSECEEELLAYHLGHLVRAIHKLTA